MIVNDYGGSISGEGPRGTTAADKVVAEIKAAGGEAAANYEDVTAAAPGGGEAMVKQAMNLWGRLDIVICNAGVGVYKVRSWKGGPGAVR